MLAVVALLAAVALGAVALSRSDEETPERAIYNLAHDVEHADADGACDRLFPSTALPVAAAEALELPVGRDVSWDAEHRRCVRDFAGTPQPPEFDFEEPRVRSVRRLSVAPQKEVTAAATALVALGGDPPTTVKLVEFRGRWRVVFEAR